MQIQEILQEAVRRQASDILIIAGLPVAYKVHGTILRVGDRLLPADTAPLVESIYALAGQRSMEQILTTGDDDFSFALPGLSRFRVNVLYCKTVILARKHTCEVNFFYPVAEYILQKAFLFRLGVKAILIGMKTLVAVRLAQGINLRKLRVAVCLH